MAVRMAAEGTREVVQRLRVHHQPRVRERESMNVDFESLYRKLNEQALRKREAPAESRTVRVRILAALRIREYATVKELDKSVNGQAKTALKDLESEGLITRGVNHGPYGRSVRLAGKR